MNYFALYQYCKNSQTDFDEIEKRVKEFLINATEEAERNDSKKIADYFNVEHQIIRSILFQLEKRGSIKLSNAITGISWISVS